MTPVVFALSAADLTLHITLALSNEAVNHESCEVLP